MSKHDPIAWMVVENGLEPVTSLHAKRPPISDEDMAEYQLTVTPLGRLPDLDDLTAAIQDSLGPDWTADDAARAVLELLTNPTPT